MKGSGKLFVLTIIFLVSLGFLLFLKVYLAEEVRHTKIEKKITADKIAAVNEHIKYTEFEILQKYSSAERIIRFAEDSLGLVINKDAAEELIIDKQKADYIVEKVSEKYE